MHPAKWNTIETVFQSALDLPLDQRRQHVSAACDADQDIQREVMSLLEVYEGTEGETDLPVSFDLQGVAPRDTHLVGSRIGPYTVIRELGRGGMSRVLLGIRADDEYHRWVAVKVLQSHVRESRFLAERQILANLDHPNIAVLFDGGTTPDRLPYLVMEYIDGMAIDEYCESRRLSIEQRLELFDGVCAALSYAHRKLVIHRDVKPSNILVNAEGAAKLLDFGIAKLLDPEDLASDATATELRAMTPGYASPEHLRGEPMTTSSDIYSLGVLLYKLLTGVLPHPAEISMRWESLVEEREPAPPSKVCRHLDADLDAIVLRALAPEPKRRYSSVAHLAEDLKRYRRGWPIEARADSTAYRLGKFVRRHPLGVTAAVGFAAFLVTVVVVLGIMAARITRERDQARIERDKVQKVTEFMIDVFGGVDPELANGNPMTVLQALDRGSRSVVLDLAEQPETQAALLNAMGLIYRKLGAFDQAYELLWDALTLRRDLLGSSHPETLANQAHVAAVLTDLGEFARSESLLRDTLAAQRTILDADSPDLVKTLEFLGVAVYRAGAIKEAEKLFREALGIELRRSEERVPEVVGLRVRLGLLFLQRGDFEAAESELSMALALGRQHFDDDDPRLLSSLKALADLHMRSRRFLEAEELYLQVLDSERKIFQGDHANIAFTLNHLGVLKTHQGDLEAAADLVRSGLEMRQRLFGDQHLSLAPSTSSLASIEHGLGNHETARALFRKAIEIARKSIPSGNPGLAYCLVRLAFCLMEDSEFAAAEPLLVEGLEIRRRDLPAGDPRIAEAEAELERCRRGWTSTPGTVPDGSAISPE